MPSTSHPDVPPRTDLQNSCQTGVMKYQQTSERGQNTGREFPLPILAPSTDAEQNLSQELQELHQLAFTRVCILRHRNAGSLPSDPIATETFFPGTRFKALVERVMPICPIQMITIAP